MSILERISQIDRKFAWSFLGVLLAIFGFWYFRDNPASLQVDLVSKARVYDVHAEVPGLAIQFEGENIREKKQVLSFFTVRMSNPGGKPITQEMFDKNLVFGFELSSGRAFPPELVEASQQYLRDNLRPTLATSNRLELAKVVIDPAAHFTIRFLVIHPESVEPTITPIGKIAGSSFEGRPVVVPLDLKAKQSFWSEVVSGSPFVHAVRFLGYIVLMIALGLGIVVPLAAVDTWRTKRRNRRIADKFRAYQGGRDSTHANLLTEIASEYGDKGLTLMARIDELHLTKADMSGLVDRFVSLVPDETPRLSHGPFSFANSILARLMGTGVLYEAEGRFVTKKGLKENLEDFRVFWHATEPSDVEATKRFVDRAIRRLKRDAQSEVPPNGGAAAPSGNSGVAKGSPSVS